MPGMLVHRADLVDPRLPRSVGIARDLARPGVLLGPESLFGAVRNLLRIVGFYIFRILLCASEGRGGR